MFPSRPLLDPRCPRLEQARGLNESLAECNRFRPEGATPTLAEGNALGLITQFIFRAWKARPTLTKNYARLKQIWFVHSGRNGSLDGGPRALPSATVGSGLRPADDLDLPRSLEPEGW